MFGYLSKWIPVYLAMLAIICNADPGDGSQHDVRHSFQQSIGHPYIQKLLPVTSGWSSIKFSQFETSQPLESIQRVHNSMISKDGFFQQTKPYEIPTHVLEEISKSAASNNEEITRNKVDRKRQKKSATENVSGFQTIIDSALKRTEMILDQFASDILQLEKATNETNEQLKMNILPRLENIEKQLNLTASIDCKQKDTERIAQFSNFSQRSQQDRELIRQELSEWVNILVVCKLPLNDKYGKGNETAFHIAANVDAAEAALLLIRKGADIQAKAEKGKTPLHLAAKANAVHVLNLLMEKRANVSEEDAIGRTALFDAAETDTVEAAQILLDHKANASARDMQGNQPIHLAAQKNSVHVLKLLIDHKASVNAFGMRATPLHLAAYDKAEEAVQILLENGADVTLIDDFNETALHLAVRSNATKVVMLLLQYKSPLNGRNWLGYTPLYWAVTQNNLPVVKLLLEHGADINSRTWDNSTALHEAVRGRYFEVMKVLLDNGIDIRVKNLADNTAYTVASLYGCKECVEILSKYG